MQFSPNEALLAEVLTYPGIPMRWRTRDIGAPTTPLLTTILRKGETEIRFFSTFTTFGTPNDVAFGGTADRVLLSSR